MKKTRLFIYNFLFEMDIQNSKTLRYILKNSIYKWFFKIITLTTVFSLLNVSFIFLFSQETNRLESLWKCKQILVLLLTGKVTAGIRINFIGRYFWTWTDPIRFEYRLILSILVQHLVKCETYSFNVITIINK